MARRHPARSFLTDRRGVAAIEFAFILPILITLYFGLFELTRMTELSRKATLYARSVADLTGQLPAQTPGKAAATSAEDVEAIFDGAEAILAPFPSTNVSVIVSALGVEKDKGKLAGRVCSSYARNTSARADKLVAGTSGLPDVPATYNFEGARYVVAEVTVPYTPLIGDALYKSIFGPGGMTFVRQVQWAERNGEITLPPKTTLCPTT